MQLPKLIQLRHELHQFPEVSGNEARTAQRIEHFLANYQPDQVLTGLGGHGLAAFYTFSEEGPLVMIRCELDALPIVEENDFPHKSTINGISHKCGHDGHMAILAGLAPWLHRRPFDHGKVLLLFQPAEENGHGAAAVLKDPRFEAFQPDYAFALHNIPGSPMHEIIQLSGQFSATVQSVAIYLKGRESHAAQPEKGLNPALAIAEIIQELKKEEVPDPKREDFALLTPVFMNLGKKEYGISAGQGEVHFTLRCWHTQRMEAIKDTIQALLDQLAQKHQLQIQTDWFDYFPTVYNHHSCNQMIQRAAEKAGLSLTKATASFKFGEDFGWFSQSCPAAMFGLGAGLETPALHQPNYDFPDQLIGTGVRMFQEIIQQILGPV